MPSRQLSALHPVLAPIAQNILNGWSVAGLDGLITCTWRSNAEQDALFAEGRTAPGAIVTRARGGQSAHNFTLNGAPAALAFDFVPMRNGKPVWSAAGADLALWQQLAEVAKAQGLEWYGDPDAAFHELPHLQHPLWQTVKPK